MSAYLPPTNILPIFNTGEYSVANTTLTLADADLRYLKLTGGIESGLVSFASGLNSAGAIGLTNTTQSTSAITGAMICAGGVGIAKDMYVAGSAYLSGASSSLQLTGASSNLQLTGASSYASLSNTTASTSSTTGALRCAGGAYIGKTSTMGPGAQILVDTSDKAATPWTAPKYSFSGFADSGGFLYEIPATLKIIGTAIAGKTVSYSGLANAGGQYFGVNNADGTQMAIIGADGPTGSGYLGCAGRALLTNSTQSTSSTTGGTVISGGLGIARDLYTDGSINLTNTSSGSITASGQPMYIVYGNSGSQTIPNGQNTIVSNAVWNGSTSTQGSGISWNGATGTYTVSNAGIYFITASCAFTSNGSTARRFLRINCSDGQVCDTVSSLGGFTILWSVSSFFKLGAGATINIIVSQDTGGDLNLTSAASPAHKFAIYKLA